VRASTYGSGALLALRLLLLVGLAGVHREVFGMGGVESRRPGARKRERRSKETREREKEGRERERRKRAGGGDSSRG
jgi:hypothetical protein